MDPMVLTALTNVFIIVLVILVPVLLIALDVSLGLRLMRTSPGAATTPIQSRRAVTVLLVILLFVVGLFLLSLALPMGQGRVAVLLPFLLVMLVQVVFWVLLVAASVWLVLLLARRMGVVGPVSENPLDILKTRYARGEISEDQFKAMKRTLQDM